MTMPATPWTVHGNGIAFFESANALAERRIAGAGLDVFDNEPHVPAALTALDNVVLTPHTASATHETRRAMADLVLENLHAFYTTGAVRVPVPGTVAG